MDINELEDIIDQDTTIPVQQEYANQDLTAIPNISNSGEALSSPETLAMVFEGLTKGEVHVVSIGGPDVDGVTEIVLENNNGGRSTFRVNWRWKGLIVRGAEAYAIMQGAAVSPNSPSLEMDVSTSRFSGAIWYSKIQEQEIVLAGIGGIGSYVAFLLGRMKPRKLIMYDPDAVERVNMSGQLYGEGDLRELKVSAMRGMLINYCGYAADTLAKPYEENSSVRPIMICGFDNMQARRLFYNRWKGEIATHINKDEYLFIDGRLAAEEYQVFAIQGNDDRAMKEYEDKWLFSDEEAEETICSYKQTTFMANMIASTMVNIFVNFIANLCNPPFPREVPFFTSYDASTMFTKVEL